MDEELRATTVRSNETVSRIVKKIELANRVSIDLEEFNEYLLSISDSHIIEEFFNKCHDSDDGKFCPTGGSGSKGGSTKSSTIKHLEELPKKGKDQAVEEIKRFTELFIGLPGQSSLRAHKFAKTNLKHFSSRELVRFRSQFQTDFKNLRTARNTAFLGIATIPINTNRIPIAAISASRSAIVIGFAAWRMKKISDQINRINKHLAGLKTRKTTSLALEEFQMDSTKIDPSLIDEIKAAQEDIDNGRIEKTKSPTKKELADAVKFVNSLKVDPEEGIYDFVLEALKDIVK